MVINMSELQIVINDVIKGYYYLKAVIKGSITVVNGKNGKCNKCLKKCNKSC